jgi:hypothetical protein
LDVVAKEDYLTGMDSIRVLDPRSIQAPDFLPAPRLIQEAGGNAPERIAANDDVLGLDRIGGFGFQPGGVRGSDGERANGRCDREGHARSGSIVFHDIDLSVSGFGNVGAVKRPPCIASWRQRPGRLYAVRIRLSSFALKVLSVA